MNENCICEFCDTWRIKMNDVEGNKITQKDFNLKYKSYKVVCPKCKKILIKNLCQNKVCELCGAIFG